VVNPNFGKQIIVSLAVLKLLYSYILDHSCEFSFVPKFSFRLVSILVYPHSYLYKLLDIFCTSFYRLEVFKVSLHYPFPKVPSGQVRSIADKSARSSLEACLSRAKTGLTGSGNRPDRFLCVAAQTGL